MKKISSASIWLIVFVLVIFASLALLETNKNVSTISVDQFQEHWNKKEIKSIQVREDKTVVGELSDGTQYETIVPLERLLQVMDKNPNPSNGIDRLEHTVIIDSNCFVKCCNHQSYYILST